MDNYNPYSPVAQSQVFFQQQPAMLSGSSVPATYGQPLGGPIYSVPASYGQPLGGPIYSVPASYGQPLGGAPNYSMPIDYFQAFLCQLISEHQSCLTELRNSHLEIETLRNKKTRDSVEYLVTDKTFGITRRICQNDQKQTSSAQIFMTALIEKVIGFPDNEGEIGAWIFIKSSVSKDTTSIVLTAKELTGTVLVDKILVPGVKILSKCSKATAARLLEILIKGELQPDSFLVPRKTSGWYMDNTELIYINGYNRSPIDAQCIDKKRLLGYKRLSENPEFVINEVLDLTSMFKDSTIGTLLILMCIGGFLKSLILRQDSQLEKMICICSNGVNIYPVIDKFFSIWENSFYYCVNASVSEKAFDSNIQKIGDELLVIDSGCEISHNVYREGQRKANIQSMINGTSNARKCFSLIISSTPADIFQLNHIIPIMIECGDIHWDKWHIYSGKPYIMADFINLVRKYIEKQGATILKSIGNQRNYHYFSYQQMGYDLPELSSVFSTIIWIINEMLKDNCIEEATISRFNQLSNGIGGLLHRKILYTEYILEEFIDAMYQLCNSQCFLFWERYNESPAPSICMKCCIYYDDRYLYMSLEDFKKTVLGYMQEDAKYSVRILLALEEADIVSRYGDAKDFCVDVSIRSLIGRKSMLRFKRDKFQPIGEPDIIERGNCHD